MPEKTCPTCGKQHNAVTRCPYCNATMPVDPVPEHPEIPDTKENRVILRKIATKQEQVNTISQVGPVLVFVLGIPALIFYIVPGLILMGIGYSWSASRDNEKQRLMNEIKELEAELG